MGDKLCIDGRIHWTVHNPDGSLACEGRAKNQIKNAGKTNIIKLLGYGLTGGASLRYLAVGSSSTANSASQTELVDEILASGLTRIDATITNPTTSTANDTLRFTGVWTVTADAIIEEAGILTASVGGILVCRVLTGTINVYVGQVVTFNYDLVVT